MHQIYLSLGSNLGNRTENLKKALSLLAVHLGKVTGVSSVYETEPWGHNYYRNYLNQVVGLKTSMTPEALLETLHDIEKRCGRHRPGVRYEPRTLDIDILFYDSLVISMDHLEIPHPKIPERRFVLVPLAEIAPAFIHPVLGKTVEKLLECCTDDKEVLYHLGGRE